MPLAAWKQTKRTPSAGTPAPAVREPLRRECRRSGALRPAVALSVTALSLVQIVALIWIRAGSGASCPDPELAAATVAVPIELRAGVPIVDVMVCGEGPYPFLIDTGASSDGRIDRALAVRLGLLVAGMAVDGDGSGRNERRRPIVRVPSIEIGGARFRDRQLLAATYEGSGSGVLGVLGFGLFEGLRVTLDQPRLRLVLEEAGGLGLGLGDEKAEIPFNRPRGVPEVMIQLGSRSTSMLLDSGAATGLLLPSWATEALQTIGEPRATGVGRTFNNEFPVVGAYLAHDLNIGGIRLRTPYARFSDHLPHALLGNELLARYSVTFDTGRDVLIVR